MPIVLKSSGYEFSDFVYFHASYRFMLKKITIFFCLLFACNLYGQVNKTLKDSVFQKGDIIRTTNILFGLSHPFGGRFELDSVKPIADFLQRYSELIVEVAVHTDSRGSYEGNYHLSNSRAHAIRDVLVNDFHIDSSRISSKGYGESKLIIKNNQIEKAKSNEDKNNLHSINRRTELIITEVKAP